MLIDLRKYFIGEDVSESIETEVDLSQVEVDGVYPFVTPVSVKGTMTAFASSAEMKATATYRFRMPCNRCLKETEKCFSHDISHVIVRELHDEEDFDEYIVAEGDTLDVDELIYSDVLLLLPTKYVCSDDCKGLCPKCGQNLNDGDCACEKQQIDPRLEALKQLLN